jgi:hypothetical protein
MGQSTLERLHHSPENLPKKEVGHKLFQNAEKFQTIFICQRKENLPRKLKKLEVLRNI